MNSFTPGPWLRDGTSVYALEHAGWKKGEEVLQNRFWCSVQNVHAPQEELLATAQLISVAPELVEALQDALGVCQAYATQSVTAALCAEKAEAVLKKALKPT